MSEQSEPPARDYERDLGVVECLVAVQSQCPHGAVRAVAERALEEIKTRRPGVLREQAFLMLSAMTGWRGPRAQQVHRSLTKFIAPTDKTTSA